MIDKDYFDQKLAEIPEDFLQGAVNYLKENFNDEVKQSILNVYKEEGKDWWVGGHSFWGMGIRNFLREGGFKDDQLPDGNWDDYYVQVVELAVGIRNGNQM